MAQVLVVNGVAVWVRVSFKTPREPFLDAAIKNRKASVKRAAAFRL